MYKTLLLILFFSCLSLAQDKPKAIFIEHNSIFKDTSQVELFSYRVPYNHLLFTKQGDQFTATFSLAVELFDGENFVQREIVTPNVQSPTYDETLAKNEFYQDYFELKLQPGEYTLKTIFSLSNSDVVMNIPEQKIKVENLSKHKIFGPLIIAEKKGLDNTFEFINFGNIIPFSPRKFSLLFGVLDPNIDSLDVSITQLKKELYSSMISPRYEGDINLSKKNNKLYLSTIGNSKIRYIHVTNFSHLLYEGSSEIIINYDTSEVKYNLTTNWVDKPKILNNPEYCIKLLSYIEDEELVGRLLSFDEEDYYKNLTEYWIDNYPSDNMKYNYAMEEYYTRADYALKNFSSLNSFDGAERSRGKIYMLYGEPTSTERNYTEKNEIVEIWFYKKLNKRFVFKDVDGTGKLDLAE